MERKAKGSGFKMKKDAPAKFLNANIN